MNGVLIPTRQNPMCEYSAYVAFCTATDGQTDIKHEKKKTLR